MKKGIIGFILGALIFTGITSVAAFTGLAVYKCDAKQKETVSFSHNQGSATGISENFLLYSIKIN